MKLIKARVKKFRNYVDSNVLNVEDSITSLIGKNESGKTAFLKALYSIKPDNQKEVEITVKLDYPRWTKVRDARQENLEEVQFIEAHFSLENNDISKLNNVLDMNIPKDTKLLVKRSYNKKLKAKILSDEKKWVESFLKSGSIAGEIKDSISNSSDINDIVQKLTPIRQKISKERVELEKENQEKTSKNVDLNGKVEEINQELTENSDEPKPEEQKVANPELLKIKEEIAKNKSGIDNNNEEITKIDAKTSALDSVIASANKFKQINKEIPDEYIDDLIEILPTFFYFGSYSTLKGRIDLDKLLAKEKSKRDKEDQTACALLKLVNVDGEELTDPEYELRKAELESAASEMTNQVLDYWTQNQDISVDLDTVSEEIIDPNSGQKVLHRCLDVRLRDQRHNMTTNFRTRSSGFQWFVSFLVAFSDFTDQENVIILLDEPGLGLHGSAQRDLLNYIEKELSKGRQVIYTNHSPFMVNPKRLERVRLVEDNTSSKNRDLGAKILDEPLNVKMPETIFPLQAALGYDIAQNLFIGQNNLVVEGPSDFSYLDLLSEHLKDNNRISLDDKIIITPVGGADKIPTFVALLGKHLDVTVLVDANMKSNQKLQDLITLKILQEKRLVNIGQFTSNGESANIEDLFSDEEYLSLYNDAFETSIQPKDVPGDESIVTRIEKIVGKYNHYGPLKVLQRDLGRLDKLSEETLKKAENLFDALNKTYKDNDL